MNIWPLAADAAESYLGNWVRLELRENKSIKGWLYTVDPETDNVVLITNNNTDSGLGITVALNDFIRQLFLEDTAQACPIDLTDDQALLRLLEQAGQASVNNEVLR